MASDVTAESFSSRKVCLGRAREHLGNRNYRSGRQTLERGLRQWPDLEFDPDFLTILGHVAWKQNRFREAMRLLKLAARNDDHHVEARFVLGRVLLDSGRPEAAIRVLARIVQDEDGLVPYRVHAGGALSVAYSALGLNKSSQDALEIAAKFGLISAQLLADEGYRLMRVGAYPEAEVQLAKGLQVDSTCEDAFFRLSNTLLIEEKLEPAMEVLAYGIEQSPEYIPFYTLMAEMYANRGQFKEASAFLRRAIEISPTADDADIQRFTLGCYLHRGGRAEGAQMAFRETLKLSPRTTLKPELLLRLKALDARDPKSKSVRLPGFPRKLQKRAFCAPNTMANVLTFVGAPAGQEEVAARVFRGAGTHWPEMFDYLRDLGNVAWRGFFGTIEQLKKCIETGLPVITTEYYGTSGHAIAVIGYDDVSKLIVAQDPRFLEPVEIPYETFEQAWQHDDSLCVAVTKTGDRKRLPAQSGDDERLVREYIELLRARNDGNDPVANRLANEMLASAPEKQTPLRIQAELALEHRNAAALRKTCEDALKRWPRCFWARRLLGDACWIEGDAEGARKHYASALRIDRRDHTLLYTLGELLLSQGRRLRGRVYLLRALAEDARMHRARLRLAEDLHDNGENELAAFHLRLLIEYEPEHTRARELLAAINGNTAVRTLAEQAKRTQENVARVQDAAARKAEQEAQERAKKKPAPQAESDGEIEIDLGDM